MIKDTNYMKRCLQLALNGLGDVAPNPMVGSVVVFEDRIIGEGYHRQYGKAHAEVNAIRVVSDDNLLKSSTIYVNLEPCSHFGKTPPCADLIIAKRIPRVVIACVDSFSEVSGRGIEKLRNAGCSVNVGVLEAEARELNKRFFTFHEKKRPYIILKWAQTQDGYIDILRLPNTPLQPNWITDETARMLVHKWRAEETGIAVGKNTALKDNPQLNTRDWAGKSPVRILFDRNLEVPVSAAFYNGAVPTYIFTSKPAHTKFNNVEIFNIRFDLGNAEVLKQALNVLYAKQVQSIIVEGGAGLLTSFIEADLWDEARVFRGNKWFGRGIQAPDFPFQPASVDQIKENSLYFYRNKSGI